MYLDGEHLKAFTLSKKYNEQTAFEGLQYWKEDKKHVLHLYQYLSEGNCDVLLIFWGKINGFKEEVMSVWQPVNRTNGYRKHLFLFP